jgi:site-specific recombinase XerD
MAARKRKGRKLSTGIYLGQYSIRAVVDIAAGRKEKKFPRDTPLPEMKRWRNETRTKLEALHPQKRAGAMGRGTFTAEIKRHLKTLTIGSWKSRRSELRAWAKYWGPKRRSRIRQEDAKRVIKAWVDAEVPAKTILNRCRALTAMYHDLDGADSWTPVDGVTIPKPPKRLPKYVHVETILKVEAHLREHGDPKTHARFMVLAATGARPAHLMKADKNDVDLARRVWNLTAVKGGEPIPLYLNDDHLAAFEAFIAADAWGPFDTTKHARELRAAGWPAHIDPYTTKHSVGQDLGAAGMDKETIKDWFGQTDTQTTTIYTGVIARKLRDASQALNGRLGWTPRILADSLGPRSEMSAKPRQQADLQEEASKDALGS